MKVSICNILIKNTYSKLINLLVNLTFIKKKTPPDLTVNTGGTCDTLNIT